MSIEEVNDSTSPKALREAYDALLKKHNAATEQLNELNKTVRSSSITSALASAGVTNTALASYFPENLDPNKTEDVTGWIEANKNVFNFGISAPENNSANGQQPEGQAPAQQQTQNPLANAFVQGSQQQQSTTTVESTPNNLSDYQARLEAAKTPAEVSQILQEQLGN